MTEREDLICLELPSSFKYLRIISEAISGILSTLDDIPDYDQLVYGIQLAVHEACTNIVEHAYGEEHTDGRISVNFTLAASPRRLLIELFDTGVPFPQIEVKKPNPEEPQIGGYGLYLIDQLMDEVRYETTKDGNYLHLTKML